MTETRNSAWTIETVTSQLRKVQDDLDRIFYAAQDYNLLEPKWQLRELKKMRYDLQDLVDDILNPEDS